jgi:hypothetical protein
MGAKASEVRGDCSIRISRFLKLTVTPNSFLVIALSSDFVMSSVFAFSASHLAWITRNKETENLVIHHRGVAMKGLQKAISTFSKENCDAILAAYTLLSWQATEW